MDRQSDDCAIYGWFLDFDVVLLTMVG
jgi:hypothetical protein